MCDVLKTPAVLTSRTSRRETGVDFFRSRYRRPTVLRRIHNRMMSLRIACPDMYLDHLRPSMHSPRHRERAGVGAQPANGRLPHLLGGCVEQQVGIDVAQEP